MAKKSFFERLTGATTEETERIEPEKVEEEFSVDSNEDFDEEKTFEETTIKKKKKPDSVEEEPVAALDAENKKEWLPEEEGQLTIDVYQTDADVIIKSTIAGVKAEDLDISINDNTLTIKGIREQNKSISQENYYCQELYWGPFSRSVILPVEVDIDRIKASIKNGILTIKLPKTEKLKTKTIKVKMIE